MRYSRDISFCRRLFLSRRTLIAAKRTTDLQKPLNVYMMCSLYGSVQCIKGKCQAANCKTLFQLKESLFAIKSPRYAFANSLGLPSRPVICSAVFPSLCNSRISLLISFTISTHPVVGKGFRYFSIFSS